LVKEKGGCTFSPGKGWVGSREKTGVRKGKDIGMKVQNNRSKKGLKKKAKVSRKQACNDQAKGGIRRKTKGNKRGM